MAARHRLNRLTYRKGFKKARANSLCFHFPCFGCGLTWPKGFQLRVLGRNLQQASVETIEAMVFDDMHTLDNNGQ